MTKDKLFLLAPDFKDPVYPGEDFFCWHCALMEGVLASYPGLAKRIDVQRIAFPRPRADVVTLVGENHQSVPMLILADDAPNGLETGRFGEVRFVQGKDEILAALARRHGIGVPHP